MRYRFITILHNLELDTIKNKGTKVFKGARISNGPQVLAETMKNPLMQTTLGIHSIDEFNGQVYFYMDGDCSEIDSRSQMKEKEMQYTFFFLRQVQAFVQKLWEIKDNNIYVRDGFLIRYQNHFEDGLTYKASLSEIFSYANNENKTSLFTDEEISLATDNFEPSTFDEYGKESFGGKFPSSKHFFKAYGSERMERAYYFVINARRSHILPMKIVSYCNALECLFTVGKSEINHKIAERVAIMLRTSRESKKELFKLIKNAYGYRSTLVHGQYLKVEEEDLVKISKELDNVLRELLVANHEIFSKNDQEIESFFIDLLFT